jgi:hypothetical protein
VVVELLFINSFLLCINGKEFMKAKMNEIIQKQRGRIHSSITNSLHSCRIVLIAAAYADVFCCEGTIPESLWSIRDMKFILLDANNFTGEALSPQSDY